MKGLSFLVLGGLFFLACQALGAEFMVHAPAGAVFMWRDVARRLAADLTARARLSQAYPKVAVASFLEEDDFNRSSPLGRLLAELLAEELHRRGFHICEARLSRAFRLAKGGEFLLSRDATKTYQRLRAQAVVTGVISHRGKHLIIQAKMISLSDSEVISLASIEFVNLPQERGPVPTVYDRL